MPVHNSEIADLFERLADLLELEDANPFRVRAYRNAARTLRGYPEPMATLLAEGADLSELPNIGDDLAAKIATIVRTGELPQLKEVEARVPGQLSDLMRIEGLGPKRVKALYRELDVRTADDLRRAAQADRLIPLAELLRHAPQSFLADGKARLLVYYAQVWALVHFLAEGEDGRYRDALRRLLIEAARGRLAGEAGDRRLGPGVLMAYIDTDLEAFEQRYVQFVRHVVRTGGRNRIVRGHSPLRE